ncbi:hypothetical protein AYO41_01670 [Verrucomicrobia bacterium SCGC AG-212-E04]|nr:hypothetical protein AYO41_01670 [Verrucomicrobia bacterium SCGC AG-212-E04]
MRNSKNGGFTLVEIMIVVAIIALLAAIAVPGFLRARKRAQGTSIKNDLRLIDAAVDQYAIEYNLGNATLDFTQLTRYFKTGTNLSNGAGILTGVNYASVTYPVGTLPVVPTVAVSQLSDVCDDAFWSPYPTS